MCGIAGLLRLDGSAVDLPSLQAMAECQAHRGPDDSGVWTDGPCGLAHRRLSIIDLSHAASQPMADPSGRYHIVYNGEVYNYRELRTELELLGYTFRTRSDTEVVLASYAEWGDKCPERFNGMFALAVWDRQARRLFCARDRLGIKPFYYATTGGAFVFASEIKGLFASGLISPKPNRRRVVHYLAYDVCETVDDTFFDGVAKLPAGCCMLVSSGPPRIARYWDLPRAVPAQPSDEEAAERIGDLFRDSVRLRLRSDVPIGFCLSGGLDSTSIAVTAPRVAVGDDHAGLEAFCSCFEDERFDERRYSDLAAAEAGVHCNYVMPGPDALTRELSDLLWHQEEPFGTTSVYAQWCLMRAARSREVPVLLDGQGADELLLGYHKYFGSVLWSHLRSLRFGDLAAEARALRRLHGYSPAYLAQLVLGCALPPSRRLQLMSRAGMTGAFALRRAALRAAGPVDDPPCHYRDPVLQHSFENLLHGGLSELLRYEDKNSMAHSIETRLPYLDYRLVEYAFSLAPPLKIADGVTKRVMREAMTGLLPEPVRTRTDKMAFITPEDEWLRGGLADWAAGLLAAGDLRIADFVDAGRVRDAFEAYRAGRCTGRHVWRWLCCETWMRRMLP